MVKNTTGVRIAGPADVDAVMQLLQVGEIESPFGTTNWDKVRKVITACANGAKDGGAPAGMIGVIDGPEHLEASVGLLFSQWWSTDEMHIEEIYTFVHPEHRKSTHAKMLYRFGKWLSDELGHIPILFGVMTVHRMAPKVRLAQRELPQAGALFVYNANIPGLFNQREFAGEEPGPAARVQ